VGSDRRAGGGGQGRLRLLDLDRTGELGSDHGRRGAEGPPGPAGHRLHGPEAGSGSLYRTTDGGLQWRYEGTTPTDGSILFTSTRQGWVAGSAQAGERLFHTTDGGHDWIRVHFPPPPGTSAGSPPDYGLPLHLGGGRLVIPVLLNNEGEKDALGFGTTRIGL
jgi:hypothetical protein